MSITRVLNVCFKVRVGGIGTGVVSLGGGGWGGEKWGTSSETAILWKDNILEFETVCHLHALQLATGQVHWTVVQKAWNICTAES